MSDKPESWWRRVVSKMTPSTHTKESIFKHIAVASTIGVILAIFAAPTPINTPEFPKLVIQEIDSKVTRLSPQALEKYIAQLVGFRHHLNVYLDTLCAKTLFGQQGQHPACKKPCHYVNDLPRLSIPPRITIHDDGRLSDNEIIERLVDHVNYLKKVMKDQNALQDKLIAENKRDCLH